MGGADGRSEYDKIQLIKKFRKALKGQIMSDRQQVKPKPKIIKSHFNSIYEQAFHQDDHPTISITQDFIQQSLPAGQIVDRPRKKTVLDILSKKITISEYNTNNQKQQIERMRDKRRSISHWTSGHPLSTQKKHILQPYETDYRDESLLEETILAEASAEEQFIKKNIEKFFQKQGPKNRQLVREYSKSKIKVIIRPHQSMKNLSTSKTQQRNRASTPSIDTMMSSFKAKESPSSYKKQREFNSLTALSRYTPPPSVNKFKSPLPILNHNSNKIKHRSQKIEKEAKTPPKTNNDQKKIAEQKNHQHRQQNKSKFLKVKPKKSLNKSKGWMQGGEEVIDGWGQFLPTSSKNSMPFMEEQDSDELMQASISRN